MSSDRSSSCGSQDRVMVNSAEKIRLAGNPNVMVCEKGTMFGYIRLTLNLACWEKVGWWSVDSGGLRELIPCIARMAVAVGVDGIFMEVHDDPLNAPVDGPTQWPLHHSEELLEELVAIADGKLNAKQSMVVKGKLGSKLSRL
nr:2-dehydro-3-deoxyphosphooctonate aldolase 2 [Quercus suber]